MVSRDTESLQAVRSLKSSRSRAVSQVLGLNDGLVFNFFDQRIEIHDQTGRSLRFRANSNEFLLLSLIRNGPKSPNELAILYTGDVPLSVVISSLRKRLAIVWKDAGSQSDDASARFRWQVAYFEQFASRELSALDMMRNSGRLADLRRCS